MRDKTAFLYVVQIDCNDLLNRPFKFEFLYVTEDLSEKRRRH